MKWLEWLWSLLPDKCEICNGRKGGVRGNENIVHGKVMCDYCDSIASNEQELDHWLMHREPEDKNE